MFSTFFLVIIAVALIIGLWFLIPALIQIKSSAKKVEEFVNKAESILIPLAEEVRETNREVRLKLNNIDNLVHKVDEGVEPLVHISKALKPVTFLLNLKPFSYLQDISAAVAGFKKGLNFILGHLTKGGEDK